MFGRKKNNFYRYMFQKSFMPLFAMLVVISMAFLIFFRITVVREKQKNRENDQRRLETCVSFTELQMKEIEKWGKQLLNGVELQKFVYMYDDLGRYSRFSLQNEIYESVYDLYYKNEQVDSVVLYIPTMGKVITDLHCQTSVKPWMEEMAEGKDRTCLLENNIETNLQQKILVSQSNLKQLQSQISPHFMYNSYYVLYRMIRRGDQENSLHLAEYLGSFYHYITRNADDEKHLSEEIEHAENYARIQKYRFRDNLHVEIAKPDECIADVYVPRLILQPILENAFKYAYESGNGDPMRLELGYEIRSDRDFDIIIENSGEISDETLQSLNEKLQSTDMQMETTAIININRRLKLYFGDKSGLLVGRSELGGLKVIVHVFVGEETS